MYPRKVTLESPRLKDLLVKKGELVNSGRKLSEDIEFVEAELEKTEAQIMAAEKKVDIGDLNVTANDLTDQLNVLIAKMEEVKKDIYARMKEEIPVVLYNKYDEIKENKEKMESERNKIALKVQKANDRIIPLGRKTMQPFLENEFEDYNTLELEDGKVVGTIFSHLQEFETKFRDKLVK